MLVKIDEISYLLDPEAKLNIGHTVMVNYNTSLRLINTVDWVSTNGLYCGVGYSLMTLRCAKILSSDNSYDNLPELYIENS